MSTLVHVRPSTSSPTIATILPPEKIHSLDFIGSFKTTDGVPSILKSLHEIIKFNLDEFHTQPSSSDAFALLRTKVQEAGIFVLLIGNLGSHHTSIDVDIFRGFALADDLAPFIIINDQDSHSAWSFTLIHELVHLLLGQTGISGGTSELAIERFCNQVSSEFILPSNEIDDILIDTSSTIQDMEIIISQFARNRNISSSMVAYKLYLVGKIDHETWTTLHDNFRKMWLKERTDRRKKTRESEGGPNYYIIKQHRLGTPLIHLVHNMMTAGDLSTSKAGKVLGIKPNNVQHLFDITRQGNIAFDAG